MKVGERACFQRAAVEYGHVTASLGCVSVGSGRVGPATGDFGSSESSVQRPDEAARADPGCSQRSSSDSRTAELDLGLAVSAARTARKSATAATSWTRSMCAPASTPYADRRQRAGQPLARRPTGDRADEVLARDGQQQRPAERVQRRAARSTSTVWAGVLAKSGPGSSISCSKATPRASASSIRSPQERRRRPSITRPSRLGSSSFCLGAARVCISTSAGAGLGAHVGELGVPQPADVVDDRRAGGDRRPRPRPACRCRPRRGRRARRRPARSAARPARSPRRASTAGRLVTPDSPPMSITSAPAPSSARASATRVVERLVAGRRRRTSPGVALTIPISHGRSPSSRVPPEVRSNRAGALTRRRRCRALHRSLGGGLLDHRSTSRATRARPSRARAPSPGRPGAAPRRRARQPRGRRAGRAGSGAAARRRRLRLLVARRERRLGEQVGQSGDDRLRELAALGCDLRAPARRHGRSGRRVRRRRSSGTPSTTRAARRGRSAARAGSRACGTAHRGRRARRAGRRPASPSAARS